MVTLELETVVTCKFIMFVFGLLIPANTEGLVHESILFPVLQVYSTSCPGHTIPLVLLDVSD